MKKFQDMLDFCSYCLVLAVNVVRKYHLKNLDSLLANIMKNLDSLVNQTPRETEKELFINS